VPGADSEVSSSGDLCALRASVVNPVPSAPSASLQCTDTRLVRPRVVLLVGKLAVEEFLGKNRLEDVVGTAVEWDGVLLLSGACVRDRLA